MTTNKRTSAHRVTTLLAAGLLGTGLAAATAVPAFAAEGSGTVVPNGADLAAARAAVSAPAVMDRLGLFFARHGVPPTQESAVSAAQEQRTAAAETPRLSGATVPVFTLDAAFVQGTAGAPVATADFLASKVVAADGQAASVWTVEQGGAWKVVNIASGGDETDYAAQAARGGGGLSFREPQINAWYVLRGGRVLPLDDEARRSVGASGVSLTAYQRLVHQRYADKLPGSAYDRAGEGGGFSVDAATAAPATHDSTAPTLALGLTGGLTAATAALVALRRRRLQATPLQATPRI